MVFCGSCGHEVNEGASFCAACGAQVEAVPATPSTPRAAQPLRGTLPKEGNTPATKMRSPLPFVLAGVAVLVVVAVAALILINPFGSKAPHIERVGERVEFGTWRGAPITWRVLAIENGRALVISEDILTLRQYDDLGASSSEDINWNTASTTWAESDIRVWLNGEFFNTAFAEEEQRVIRLSRIINPNNPGGQGDGSLVPSFARGQENRPPVPQHLKHTTAEAAAVAGAPAEVAAATAGAWDSGDGAKCPTLEVGHFAPSPSPLFHRPSFPPVIVETCPQYLVLDDTLYDAPDDEGLKYLMSPPLRTPSDQEALWQALIDGRVSTVGTDHCPWDFAGAKQLGRTDFTLCPNGAPGVELRLALLYSEGVVKRGMSLERLVAVFASLPARIFGLYPRKGTIAPGSDADLVLFDPQREVTVRHELLHENVDYTPYEGFELTGWPVMTISRGEVIAQVEDAGRASVRLTFCGSVGRGKYLERNLFEGTGLSSQ